jgi:hypothetical protein
VSAIIGKQSFHPFRSSRAQDFETRREGAGFFVSPAAYATRVDCLRYILERFVLCDRFATANFPANVFVQMRTTAEFPSRRRLPDAMRPQFASG